ncbi:hypothetical protein Pth03_05430 [Planotetraspora thailandica]|uniref:Uncharacterized protein n=1 Tax=Planotetraspora thailandica TaxID=487172 RepID=A0A8J3V142_9ACTN|nr:hypothetical protein Pth03_05430 [Planotetraspora thailandica]
MDGGDDQFVRLRRAQRVAGLHSLIWFDGSETGEITATGDMRDKSLYDHQPCGADDPRFTINGRKIPYRTALPQGRIRTIAVISLHR